MSSAKGKSLITSGGAEPGRKNALDPEDQEKTIQKATPPLKHTVVVGKPSKSPQEHQNEAGSYNDCFPHFVVC
jgi:hypothetical protein